MSLSTILEHEEYLAKMNNLPNHHHHGAPPLQVRGPMQLHRLHRLKTGLVKHNPVVLNVPRSLYTNANQTSSQACTQLPSSPNRQVNSFAECFMLCSQSQSDLTARIP